MTRTCETTATNTHTHIIFERDFGPSGHKQTGTTDDIGVWLQGAINYRIATQYMQSRVASRIAHVHIRTSRFD